MSDIYRVCQKITQFVLSELRQICTKFDNFWRILSQDDKIMQGIRTVYLT